ncbi:hypothetical protein [Saccharopolyspora phatthalungensis]|uniref:Apolipoprotein N-acyltransferase n=1 Tax=Saccharopolyspora phatthalungensis TaxID=664693 RepID=A0A840QGS4_9PSEU|nr:hypothetical protein [Saccharopolyspora phatthalungensis]MBB5159327.1 apolipoprotein N-acyltransferase [Saccharopolyspora phatthalungensis]
MSAAREHGDQVSRATTTGVSADVSRDPDEIVARLGRRLGDTSQAQYSERRTGAAVGDQRDE